MTKKRREKRLERPLLQFHGDTLTVQTPDGETRSIKGVSLTTTSHYDVHPDWIVARKHDGAQLIADLGSAAQQLQAARGEPVTEIADESLDPGSLLRDLGVELERRGVDPIAVLRLRLGMEIWRSSDELRDRLSQCVTLLDADPKWLMHPAIQAHIAMLMCRLRAGSPVDVTTAKRAGDAGSKMEAQRQMQKIANVLLRTDDPGGRLERVARASEMQAWIAERARETGSVKEAMHEAAGRFGFPTSQALRQELLRAQRRQKDEGWTLPWVGFEFPDRDPRKTTKAKSK
jgi:hypothetical protein